VQTKITCTVSIRTRSIFAGVYGVDVVVIFVPYRSVNYRQEHLCTADCAAPGICDIETAPHSIEATFTGKNETFQYTKVCLSVSIGSDTDPSCSILKVRRSSCMLSHIDTITISRNDSCETLEMYQINPVRCYEAQGTP